MAAPSFSDSLSDTEYLYDEWDWGAELEKEMSNLDDHTMESRTASILDPNNFFYGRGTNQPKVKYDKRFDRPRSMIKPMKDGADTAEAYSIDTRTHSGPRPVFKPHDARWRENSKYSSRIKDCTPEYVSNPKRNTTRIRVGVQSLSLVGNETRRKAVDAGIYKSKDGPHRNSVERGLYHAKRVKFSGIETPLKLRIKIGRDQNGNEHYSMLPPRQEP